MRRSQYVKPQGGSLMPCGKKWTKQLTLCWNTALFSPVEAHGLLQLLLSRKKDGGTQLCIDYRQLNSDPQRCLSSTTQSRYFGSFKWIHMLESFIRLLASWCTPEWSAQDSIYQPQFRVLPFGLCNVTATFKWLILAGLIGTSCLVYLDDIVYLRSIFLTWQKY